MKNKPLRKPDWLKVRFSAGDRFTAIDRYHRRQGLNSVCRSAACPNQGECWSRGTATFMILGNVCTRSCRFCNVSSATPGSVDPAEPRKVAQAIAELDLTHAVITSVTRDDLTDGGAQQFVHTVREIRNRAPRCRIELLIPDLQGDQNSLTTILSYAPDILGHNLETVPRLYPQVRPEAIYERSLKLLRRVADSTPHIIRKSGLMLGMGETRQELLQSLEDLHRAGCQIITLGQYLAPTRDHVAVERYLPPAEFAELKTLAEEIGFDHVESGPLVRSSYHAEEQLHSRTAKQSQGK